MVKLKVVELGTGPISEADIKLGTTVADSLVLGFSVKATRAAEELAEREHVHIETFDIIYKLSEWLAEEIKRRTPTQQVEIILGEVKVLKIFSGTKAKQILGGTVLSGKLVDDKAVKIMRRDSEIGRGQVGELQQQKMRVKEVATGNQFGALIEAKIAIAVGDTLVAYDIVNQ
ncbi:MAG: Translation initiation factor IF-2 protein [Candidatus Giovannonibacteria bacterium GW2011_GWA2_53_7]|uniref:Translation initiation factor IF-2 protein n=1 Tax=Candidatus Giovannonibacteria bacterium GW2011_GWA2_53_7 TaxID=1618650 RepID=A0A0G1XU42_9BACT|nr:MAG: Translation initiation factor IF-2 protein [Candidatus Giovannonibacteria bacterium GW2011_GWA2_53_7]